MTQKMTSSRRSAPTLGQTIRKARLARGLTQLDVAARVGVTQEAVSRWESGANGPSLPKLKSVAQVLELDLDELVGRHPEVARA